MVALLFPKLRANETALGLMAVAVFVSLWLEKGFVMLVTGYVPSPLHDVVLYTPTLIELAVAAMVWAIGFLLLTVLYKTVIANREVADQG